MNNNNLSATDSPPDLELTQSPQEPFTDTDDPDFFYPEHTRIQRLRLLLHLISLDELLLVIGQPGAGKTMLLKQFLLQAKETASVSFIDVHGIKSEVQFFTTIAEALNLDLTQKEPDQPLKIQILDTIKDLQQTTLRTILAIDNVHELDIDCLQYIETITQHAKKHNKPLHIVMAGNPEIQKTLEHPDLKTLKQNILHTFEMPPFDEHQTKEYILHRLHAANYNDSSLFTPATIKKIYKKSEGLPERINALARQTIGPLEQYKLFSPPPISLETVEEELQEKKQILPFIQKIKSLWNTNKLVPALLVISIVAFIFFLQSTISNHFVDEPKNQRTETLNLPPIEKPAEPLSFTIKIEEPSDNSIQPTPPPQTAPPIITTAPQSPPEKSLEATEIALPSLEKEMPTQPVIDKKTVQEISTTQPPEPPPAQEVKQTAAIITPAVKRKNWINKQNAEHYTLQIFAVSKEKAMLDFIQKNQLTDQSAYLRFERNGESLYTMLYGNYENRNIASEAIKKLPSALSNFKPWIRSYGSIQEAIKNNP